MHVGTTDSTVLVLVVVVNRHIIVYIPEECERMGG